MTWQHGALSNLIFQSARFIREARTTDNHAAPDQRRRERFAASFCSIDSKRGSCEGEDAKAVCTRDATASIRAPFIASVREDDDCREICKSRRSTSLRRRKYSSRQDHALLPMTAAENHAGSVARRLWIVCADARSMITKE